MRTPGLALTALAATCLAVVPRASVGARAAALLAPDADQIAYVSVYDGTAQIHLARSDGTGVRRLTGPPGHSTTPVWSPDGRRIGFVRTSGATSRIHIVNAAGSRQNRVSALRENETSPSWAPDSRRLVYVCGRPSSGSDVCVAGAGRAERLTTSGDVIATAWSPSGRHVAFVSHRTGDQGDLFVMNADGSGITRLVTRGIVPRPGALHPAWSPDGARLLYVSRVGRAEQAISLIDITAGSNVRLMTGYAPAWSPDGRRIAFVVARVGDAQIYVTDGDGRNARRLTGGPGTNLLPAWSADGTRIAFLTFRGTALHVAVMRADGTGVRLLAPVYGDLTTLPMFAWKPK